MAVALLLPGVASARNLALLVGVADYDEPKIRALTGPRNDVIVLWRYLVRHGFDVADITVLAEGLPQGADTPHPGAAPERTAILDGLARLAAQAQPGDFVLFHFSGHGTTQPQRANGADGETPEAGGRDQVLLPKDAGLYDPGAGTIRNAIVDNELGAALDRIRAKGADVWVVVDACHAGTVTRSAEVTRGIAASDLGVPATSAVERPAVASRAPVQAPERSGTLRGGGAPPVTGTGALISFFAVDSWTPAIERAFPAPAGVPGTGAAQGDVPQATFGVFSWHLMRALEANRARSFRDLARMVSLDMAAAARLAYAPMPVFEGDLDRGLFADRAGASPRFAARQEGDGLVVEAGALQGFDEGAEIAMFDGPLADAGRIGTVRLAAASAGESRAPLAGLTIPARSGDGLWAQMEQPAVAFRFRVAGEDHSGLAELVARAFGPHEGAPAIGIEVVAPGAPADLRLQVAEGQLWLVPEGRPLVRDREVYGRSFSIPLDGPAERVAARLRDAVWAYARAANLVRIASIAEMGQAGASSEIDISLDRIRETDPALLADPRRGCAQVSQPSAPLAVDSGTAAAVAHCDTVRLTIANRSERDIDLGIFLIDPQAGIDVPVRDWRQNGCIATLPAKAAGPMVLRTTLRSWGKSGPGQIGLHRILVFALPRSGGVPPSLCHLLQRDVAAAAAGATGLRSATGHRGFIGLLARAALVEPGLRAANPFEDEGNEASPVVVRQFTLDLLPPEAGR